MIAYKPFAVFTALILGSLEVQGIERNSEKHHLRRHLPELLDPTTSTTSTTLIKKSPAHVPNSLQEPHSRKVISYHSSRWEEIWLLNLPHWKDTKSMCNAIVKEQAHLLHEYLSMLCTSRLEAPYEKWCVIDDGEHQLWYNTDETTRFDVTFERPVPESVHVSRPQPIALSTEHKQVMSWFVVEDENGKRSKEYIEPLIGHLRFPLHKCLHPVPATPQYQFYYANFKGWVLPSIVAHSRALFFSAGASAWDDKSSTSLSYFTSSWARHGMFFDEVHVYEPSITSEEFSKHVPREWTNKVMFQKVEIASSPENATWSTPFVPSMIKSKTEPSDFVLLKLGSHSPEVDANNLQAILDEEDAYHIDEIVWDHRTGGHHGHLEWVDMVPEVPLEDSYDILYQLRVKGIRAHSWI